MYDLVVCFWVLYLFDDYASTLNSVISCLKPGGKELISQIIYPGKPFIQIFKKTIKPKQMSFILPTLDKIMLAIRATLVKIDYLEIKYNYERYPNFDELFATMQKIPFFSLLPEEKMVTFRQNLLKAYPTKSDGFVYDSAHAICMILIKFSC